MKSKIVQYLVYKWMNPPTNSHVTIGGILRYSKQFYKIIFPFLLTNYNDNYSFNYSLYK